MAHGYVFCTRCGTGYNQRHRHGSCPHPPIALPGNDELIKRFDERYQEIIPLVLGYDYSDPSNILGKIELSGKGREFFGNREQPPLQFSMGGVIVGEIFIPTVFGITHPPIDPVFGDIKR